MTPSAANASATPDPKALSDLKEHVRRNYGESHPFRLEVEAISASDDPLALVERLPTLVRLLRRAG